MVRTNPDGRTDALLHGRTHIHGTKIITSMSRLHASGLDKNRVIKYCEKVYERSCKNLFWSIKNSCEVINKLKKRGFRAPSLSTYDFSTLYTTLPHNLIKDKQVDLIERIFQRDGSLYIACNDRHAFFTSDAVNIIIYGLVRKSVKLSPFS